VIALLVALQTVTPFETALLDRLSHDRFESKAFYHDLHAALSQYDLTLKWQKTYGPTAIKIGGLQILGAQAASLALWRDASGTGVQVLDECEINPEGKVICKETPTDSDETISNSQTYRSGDRLVMCGSGSSGGNFTQPAARIYQLRSGHWKRDTRADPDSEFESLPGTHFLRRHGIIDPSVVIATVEVSPDHLAQPHVGPNFLDLETWSVRNRSIQIGGRHRVESPLVELDRLAASSQNQNWPAFERELGGSRLTESDRKNLWKALKTPPIASCNHDFETIFCPMLYIAYDSDRDLKLSFKKSRARWKLRTLSYTKAH
jgi:hypothetical protein